MCGFELAGGRRNYGLKKSALNKIKQELELSYFSLQSFYAALAFPETPLPLRLCAASKMCPIAENQFIYRVFKTVIDQQRYQSKL